MKQLFGGLILLFLVSSVEAHPGVGIVQDRRGNVFFTDLTQVWKIAPDGRTSVALPNVHTHELCLDAEDNLYGEHLWYEGDATKKWGQRVWRLKPDGTASDVIPARPAFQEGYSFVRDAASNMYWASQGPPTVIKRRSAKGMISNHATADFRDVRWITSTPEGVLFLIDKGDLRRISADGKVSTLVTRLSTRTPPPANVTDRHYHQGLWTDKDGSVYVAVSEEKVVIQVKPGGAPTVVARTGPDWSPSGGLIDRDGNLWLLEYGFVYRVRARRIDKDGREHVFSTTTTTQ